MCVINRFKDVLLGPLLQKIRWDNKAGIVSRVEDQAEIADDNRRPELEVSPETKIRERTLWCSSPQ
jgi:hypothetical protein